MVSSGGIAARRSFVLVTHPLQALQQFVRAATKQDPLYDAIEVSLKGPEISLVEPPYGRQCRP